MADDSLVVAYCLNGQGGGEQLDWNGIDAWRPEQGALWVHLNHAGSETRRWLQQDSGLDPMVVEALLAEETRPRCTETARGVMLFLRGVNLNPGADPEDMVSIRLWIDEQRIISVRLRRLLSIDDLRAAIENGSGPADSGAFALDLSQRLVARMADVVGNIDDEVDELQERLLAAQDAKLRVALLRMRYQIIALRRFLAPQREAMLRLGQLRVSWLNDHTAMGLREQAERTARYVEDLDAARDRASVIQEELTGRLAEQMNTRMYVLSLVAGIFLPLGFVTGLLGINVGGIPLAESPLGFVLVLLLLAVIMAAQVLLFRYRRWL